MNSDCRFKVLMDKLLRIEGRVDKIDKESEPNPAPAILGDSPFLVFSTGNRSEKFHFVCHSDSIDTISFFELSRGDLYSIKRILKQNPTHRVVAIGNIFYVFIPMEELGDFFRLNSGKF